MKTWTGLPDDPPSPDRKFDGGQGVAREIEKNLMAAMGVACMKLTEARFCMDCEEVFKSVKCPFCGQEGVWLCQWVRPLQSQARPIIIMEGREGIACAER